MTFEQFQATRKWSDNLGDMIEGEYFPGDHKNPGNVYLGSLYIDQVQDWWPNQVRDQGEWHLILNRDEYISDDLEALERKLYKFAVAEGYTAN